MEYQYLNRIVTPRDLDGLDYRELELLCAEIRDFLIEKVSKTGGHLSSNLGVIELTVAMHRCFNSPNDMILFDVGHQCYTHKILTGRRENFDSLRSDGGISGFPLPGESPHDIIHAGHGSASLSAALGLARAKKLKNEPGKVLVVMGDGVFAGGMTYEAINNVGELDNLIVILNDNSMSISKSVGAVAQYFTRLRTNPRYYKAKRDVKSMLDSTPVIGGGVVRGIQSIKSLLRKGLYHGSTFFEDLGLSYIGPTDGHNVANLCTMLCGLKELDAPALLHVETKKGKGFTPAENNPGAFHGVPAFNAKRIADPDVSPKDSFSTAFGRKLARLAGADEQICAITAAMKYGTGLQYFKRMHRGRFFDVGMAEEHAVTFAGGLAANGMRPVVALYSTFLQRAYDQIIHDVVLGNQDVLFAIDRAGFVEGDGETHQGIYDAAFLSQQGQMPIVAPANYRELTWWLEKLMTEHHGPRAIRYPRGEEPPELADKPCSGALFDCVVRHENATTAIVTYGTEVVEAMAAAEMLQKQGTPVDVYQMLMINPVPEELVAALCGYQNLLFAEEGIAQGGIGEHLALQLFQSGFRGQYTHIAVRDVHIGHAKLADLRKAAGLDAKGLSSALPRAKVSA